MQNNHTIKIRELNGIALCFDFYGNKDTQAYNGTRTCKCWRRRPKKCTPKQVFHAAHERQKKLNNNYESIELLKQVNSNMADAGYMFRAYKLKRKGPHKAALFFDYRLPLGKLHK